MIHLDIIKNNTMLFKNNIALTYNGLHTPWHDYHEKTTRLISKLITMNKVRSFSRIAFLSENSDNLIILDSCCTTLKIPFTGIDYTIKPEYIDNIIQHGEFDLIFISNQISLRNIVTFAHNVQVIIIEDFIRNIENFMPVADEELANFVNNRTFFSLSLTSGTTGTPKIVKRTKSVDKQRFDYFISRFNFSQNDVHLCCMPMFHVSSTGWIKLFLTLGAKCVIQNNNSIYEIADNIVAHKITTTMISGYISTNANIFRQKQL